MPFEVDGPPRNVREESRMSKSSPYKIATFGAGCFWGVESLFKSLEGVVETRVGYMGGETKDPTYDDVKTGTTGHAEAVEVIYDPSRVSYEKLLSYFFRLHDPTTPNRQGVDVGTQYRSVIFYHDEEQKRAAEAFKKEFDRENAFGKPSVTEIVPAGQFYEAEEYHQDYFEKSGGPVCHHLREK
jgi:methionine-S-sulfoxide reductase